jgi:hypothetical protein
MAKEQYRWTRVDGCWAYSLVAVRSLLADDAAFDPTDGDWSFDPPSDEWDDG